VSPTFRRYDPARDESVLRDLLCSERWEYRVKVEMTEADVREELDRGVYTNDDVLTYLIEVDGEVAGYVRSDDLGHERTDPQLDFRLRERFRGRGIGQVALEFMTREIFERHPKTIRIEGQTRRDNIAMRKVFTRGGYVMEAVYRKAWPGGGEQHDGIGYAILRGDWESGTTTPADFSEPV
jgi:RimJ/RimL family protein N-acetyltransferase